MRDRSRFSSPTGITERSVGRARKSPSACWKATLLSQIYLREGDNSSRICREKKNMSTEITKFAQKRKELFLICCNVCSQYYLKFSLLIGFYRCCIFTRPTGSSKRGTTHKNNNLLLTEREGSTGEY